MYGPPQAGLIAQDHLQKHLAKYDYLPTPIISGLWCHKTQPINFTLVVYDFGVKHVGREHAEHLKNALESMYKMTTYLEGELYIRITLKWNYNKRTVEISIPGYVEASLN